uniref:Secreted protein n=1 Tax=Oncorhynchus mykiss TaxID=8022 RepID=A0A8C7NWC0_ONCMY
MIRTSNHTPVLWQLLLCFRIVGEDDGGRLYSPPEEYDEYKRTVFPQRLHSRLYLSFGRPGGIDCKLIGPETPYFCTHRYTLTTSSISNTTLISSLRIVQPRKLRPQNKCVGNECLCCPSLRH